MTEEEWLACDDARNMLLFMWLDKKASNRKMRLFACGCCRRIDSALSQLNDLALELTEQYADDRATVEALGTAAQNAIASVYLNGATSISDFVRWSTEAVHAAAYAPELFKSAHYDMMGYSQEPYHSFARAVATKTLSANASLVFMRAAGINDFDHPPATYKAPTFKKRWHEAAKPTDWIQCQLLRDIFGNPFRPVMVSPVWQMANVLALAQAIYEDRAFDRMPILADALEDAGCTNQEVLGHCRGPGPHVRGCWVLDLLLGKE